MSRHVVTLVVILAVTFAAPSLAGADTVNIGTYSQQASSERANVGGSIIVSARSPGHSGTPATQVTYGGGAGAEGEGGGSAGGRSVRPEPAFPTISSNSPQYRNPHPFGARSFWYAAEGHRCVYVPASNGACFNVVEPEAPAGAYPQPAVNPATIAAGLASRMTLQAGTIAVSPSARTAGLTGAASWFWLEPSPASESLSLSLRGEHVTVSAAASRVRWSFGDGSLTTGGAGVPYRSGAVPSGAVRHVYETRCLPGDEGHDPYVSSSCGANGYRLRATVEWSISYRASGPVAAAGGLPSRSTEASLSYPVSEARAFLTGRSAG
jgi:hypothetical protein